MVTFNSMICVCFVWRLKIYFECQSFILKLEKKKMFRANKWFGFQIVSQIVLPLAYRN